MKKLFFIMIFISGINVSQGVKANDQIEILVKQETEYQLQIKDLVERKRRLQYDRLTEESKIRLEELASEIKTLNDEKKVITKSRLDLQAAKAKEKVSGIKEEVPPRAIIVPEEEAETPKKSHEDPKNYIAETCEWVEDIPRRIIKAPTTCGRKPVSICTGHVVCKQKVGDASLIRLTTCSDDLCGKDDAVACTKDDNYSSRKPNEVESNGVSGEIKNLIKSSSISQ